MAAKKIVKDPVLMMQAFTESLVGTEYEGMIPEPKLSNLREIGDIMYNYKPLMNQFFHNLVNTIAFMLVKKMYYTNPFGFAKRGVIPFGSTIEEIWVDICKAHPYTMDNLGNPSHMLEAEFPNLRSAFHYRNRQDFFKQSINYDEVRAAFYSEEGLDSLTSRIIAGMYTSNDVTEYVYTISLFSRAIDMGMLKLVKITQPTDQASSESFLVAAREVSNGFLFPSRAYNPMGVMNTSSRDNQRVWLTPKADATISVTALAYAFHIDEASLIGRITLIPEIPNHPEILAMITDDAFLNIYDNLFEADSWWNREGRFWNYWLHVWQYYFISPFHNAVALTTGNIPTVTTVTVTGSATYTAGNTSVYTVTVTGTNNPPQYGVWTVTGNTSTLTVINEYGQLTTGYDESGTLTVIFKPYVDNTKSGSITVSPATTPEPDPSTPTEQ